MKDSCVHPSRHPSHLPLRVWAAERDFDPDAQGAVAGGASPSARQGGREAEKKQGAESAGMAAGARPRAQINPAPSLKNVPRPTDDFLRGGGI